MIVAEIEGVVPAPFQRVEMFGQRAHLADFHHRLRFDAQLFMLAQHVEVIDRVAQVIGIGIELGAGIGGDLERAQRLQPFGAGLHAQFHHCLAHRRIVAETGNMADRVEHYRPREFATKIRLIKQSPRHR